MFATLNNFAVFNASSRKVMSDISVYNGRGLTGSDRHVWLGARTYALRKALSDPLVLHVASRTAQIRPKDPWQKWVRRR